MLNLIENIKSEFKLSPIQIFIKEKSKEQKNSPDTEKIPDYFPDTKLETELYHILIQIP